MSAGDRVSTLKATVNELFKAYNVYDLEGRLTDRYEAAYDAKNGEPCVRTTMTYDGTTRRIIKSAESIATWDATWDI